MFSLAATPPRAPFVRPGDLLDWYPETLTDGGDFFQRQLAQLACSRRARALRFSGFRATARRIERAMADCSSLGEQAYRDEAQRLRAALRRNGLARDDLVRAFALAGSAVRRQFGFDVHPEQFFCASVLLNGMLAEMATGEGKSIAAALAAIVAGVAGTCVHVITANDYLVERDATSLRPLFERFGLSCGFVSAQQDDSARRAAYAASVCYVSGKQVVFDYLRDRLALGNRPSSISGRVQELYRPNAPRPLLRGLSFAIVDEADSVLIDDAVTPLILSRQCPGDNDAAQALRAIDLARFQVNTILSRADLGDPAGRDRALSAVASHVKAMGETVGRDELVREVADRLDTDPSLVSERVRSAPEPVAEGAASAGAAASTPIPRRSAALHSRVASPTGSARGASAASRRSSSRAAISTRCACSGCSAPRRARPC